MKNIEPQSYLTERGVQIFNSILSCIDERVLQSTDSFGLSVLANNYDLHHTMAEFLNENGVAQVTSTKYSQVRAEYTVFQKTAEYISKNSGAFGLTPEAREKLKEVWAKKEKKKSSLDSALGNVSTTQ
jgi:P27 family predicted phage terminase small subunit